MRSGNNAASTDTDRLGATRNVANANGGGSTGDAGEVMVFSQPKACEAGSLGMLGQIKGVGQRVGRSKTFADIGKVEHGKFNHGSTLTHITSNVSNDQHHPIMRRHKDCRKILFING
jgi:hypothetical protein